MNAIADALQCLADGDNIQRGDGIRKRVSRGMVLLSADIKNKKGGGRKRLPFEVYTNSGTSDPPVTGLSVYPGYIVTIMAKIDAVLLTADPAPVLSTSSSVGAFSVFLQIQVEGTPDTVSGGGTIGTNRYGIIKVDVHTDDELGSTAEYDTNGEVIEYKVKWDDNTVKDKGHFFIKLADVSAPPEGSPVGTIGTITQTLFSSYRSVLIAGDSIITFP